MNNKKHSRHQISAQQITQLIGSSYVFVNKKMFENGRIIITFNYRDEHVTSTIDEIIAAANNSSDIDCIGSPKPKQPNPNRFEINDRFGFVFSQKNVQSGC